MLPRGTFSLPLTLPPLHTLFLPREEHSERLGRRVVVGGGLAELRHSPTCPGRFVQQHRELELMNSFRERFGRDWLQYRNHLETSGTPVLPTSKTPALSTLPPGAPSTETAASPPPAEKESPQEMAEEVTVESEPQEEEETEEHGKEEEGKEEEKEEEEEQSEVEGEHSVAMGRAGASDGGVSGRVRKTRTQGGRPFWMEGHPRGGQSPGYLSLLTDLPLGLSSAELCRPMLVCPLEGPEGVRGRERFLRVTSGHLIEVELQAARTLERLELQSLEGAEVELESPTQREPVPEVSGGVGVLEEVAGSFRSQL